MSAVADDCGNSRSCHTTQLVESRYDATRGVALRRNSRSRASMRHGALQVGEEVAGAFEDATGDFAAGQALGFDLEVGRGLIERHPFGEQSFNPGPRVFGLQQRPVLVAGDSLQDGVHRGPQPDSR